MILYTAEKWMGREPCVYGRDTDQHGRTVVLFTDDYEEAVQKAAWMNSQNIQLDEVLDKVFLTASL